MLKLRLPDHRPCRPRQAPTLVPQLSHSVPTLTGASCVSAYRAARPQGSIAAAFLASYVVLGETRGRSTPTPTSSDTRVATPGKSAQLPAIATGAPNES